MNGTISVPRSLGLKNVAINLYYNMWNRYTGRVTRKGEGMNALKILTGKPSSNILLGGPRRRWENNIRMDLKEIFNTLRKA